MFGFVQFVVKVPKTRLPIILRLSTTTNHIHVSQRVSQVLVSALHSGRPGSILRSGRWLHRLRFFVVFPQPLHQNAGYVVPQIRPDGVLPHL